MATPCRGGAPGNDPFVPIPAPGRIGGGGRPRRAPRRVGVPRIRNARAAPRASVATAPPRRYGVPDTDFVGGSVLDLTGKAAIVTGAGSVGPGWGNGKAAAVLFARQGAAVFCIDNNPDAVAETVGIIASEGGRAVAHTADVTRSDDVKAAIEAAVAEFGRLDIMVNNVGGSAPGSAESMSEEVWDRQFDINLRSVFLGCKHALPHLRQQETSAIVNIASIAALRMSGDRPHIAYSASKMGVIGLSKSVAMEQARKGVRCNVVVPGLMNTPLVENRLLRQLGANDAATLIAKRDAQVPTGKMGTGWDVAHAVLFLASDEARYITGTEIIVDGGMSAMMPGAGAA
nr:SDR family NAD(P)-dependent oxidoreductase [Neoroseomonas soli]